MKISFPAVFDFPNIYQWRSFWQHRWLWLNGTSSFAFPITLSVDSHRHLILFRYAILCRLPDLLSIAFVKCSEKFKRFCYSFSLAGRLKEQDVPDKTGGVPVRGREDRGCCGLAAGVMCLFITKSSLNENTKNEDIPHRFNMAEYPSFFFRFLFQYAFRE